MKILSISFLLIFTGSFILKAQDNSIDKAGFEKYNKHILSPYAIGRHQLLFSTNYTIDLDDEAYEEGNIAQNQSAGVGFGYLYRIQAYEQPFSLGVGLKGEWYPGKFYKFNIIFETDLIDILLYYEPLDLIFLSGYELNMSFSPDFNRHEAHTILYLAEVNFAKFEIKWGLQSWWEKLTPIILLDESFNVVKLTYQLDI